VTDLVYTARPAGHGTSPDTYVFTIHRAGCSAIGKATARPLSDRREELLRKVRHSLNASACRRCEPIST
jgi:hypothetical protein